MKNILEAIRAALAAVLRLVTKTVQVTKKVSGKLVRVAETTTEWVRDTAVPAVDGAKAGAGHAWDGLKKGVCVGAVVAAAPFRIMAGAVSDVVRLPGRLLGSLLADRARPQQPQDAAAEEAAVQKVAQQEEAARQAASDRQAEARELIQAIRNVATAGARGERLDDVAVNRLPEGVRDYLLSLSAEECGVVAAASVTSIRAFSKGRPPEGVRNPKEVREAAEAAMRVVPAAEVEARRAERKQQIRQAVRGGVRKPEPNQAADADAIMGRYARA